MTFFDKSFCPLCGEKTAQNSYIVQCVIHNYEHGFAYLEYTQKFHVTFNPVENIVENFLMTYKLHSANGNGSCYIFHDFESMMVYIEPFKQAIVLLQNYKLIQ